MRTPRPVDDQPGHEALVDAHRGRLFADPDVNRFSNDRRLSDAEVRTLLSWVNAGVPEGNPSEGTTGFVDLSPPPQPTTRRRTDKTSGSRKRFMECP